MNEIEEILQKITNKGYVPIFLDSSDLKAKAIRLMELFPETSSWKLKDIDDLLKRLKAKTEEDIRACVIADHL